MENLSPLIKLVESKTNKGKKSPKLLVKEKLQAFDFADLFYKPIIRVILPLKEK